MTLFFHRRASGSIVGLSDLSQVHRVLLLEYEGAAQSWLLMGRAGCGGTEETWPACMPTAH